MNLQILTSPEKIDIVKVCDKEEDKEEIIHSRKVGFDISLSDRSYETRKSRLSTGIDYIISDIDGGPINWWLEFYDQKHDLFKIFLLYVGILIMSGVGAIIFYLCEYETHEKVLTEYKSALEAVNNRFDQTQLDFIHTEWDPVSQQFMDANMWELRYSAFYATTIFTTIGFGFQAPKTFEGKLCTMIYSVFAIIIYGTLASNIGVICIDALEEFFIKIFCLSYQQWNKVKVYCYVSTVVALFVILAKVIQITAVNEGFGKGIETHWDAIYFLWGTSSTIGYGDKMMSGAANPAVTLLFGIWIVCFCGMGLTILSYISHSAEEQLTSKKTLTYTISQSELETLEAEEEKEKSFHEQKTRIIEK